MNVLCICGLYTVPGGADGGDGWGTQGDAVQPALLQQRCVVIRVLSLNARKQKHTHTWEGWVRLISEKREEATLFRQYNFNNYTWRRHILLVHGCTAHHIFRRSRSWNPSLIMGYLVGLRSVFCFFYPHKKSKRTLKCPNCHWHFLTDPTYILL